MADNYPATDTEAKPTTPTFEELAKHRKLLQEFCRFHVGSLKSFASKDQPIFKLDPNDKRSGFRHITSSATCFSSVDLCPAVLHPDDEVADWIKSQGDRFAKTAIGKPLSKWRSDGAAEIYCSCRGLPFVLSRLPGWHKRIDEHLERIVYQLRQRKGYPARFGIGEAARGKGKDAGKIKETKKWYPANSYHTYWTLQILNTLAEDKFKPESQKSKALAELLDQRPGMLLWARQQLGFQIALHSADSSVLDSDQLAWALAILVSEPAEYQSNLATQDLIRQALHCLFTTQEKVGTWRHYGRLFHYPNAGNAYCYVFETFPVLLSQALRPDAAFVRDALKGYFEPPLVRLFIYAESTATELRLKNKDGTPARGFAWSSGHRNESTLESWATASVFAYAQTFRRLLGVWTREAALSSLNYRATEPKQQSLELLEERADIWTYSGLSERLVTMFVNPVEHASPESASDPDEPIIGKKFPRSAIFFGPPGTSKTTLVRAIAGCIGWRYIELHPSHFVSEGLPGVQRTADNIFSKLMELDHAVVLFDEIDELVRERELEPDQFGRFLTTSMLPRLAELWKARKVMYFIATNHIEYFDKAVTRSERFDAIVLVSPPSLAKKKQDVVDILKERFGKKATFAEEIDKSLIESAMPKDLCKKIVQSESDDERKRLKSETLPSKNALAKFALLRHDEMSELALHLTNILGPRRKIERTDIESALDRLDDGGSRRVGDYCRFTSDKKNYEHFDVSRESVWIVDTVEFRRGDTKLKQIKQLGNREVLILPVGRTASDAKIRFYETIKSKHKSKVVPGHLRIKPS